VTERGISRDTGSRRIFGTDGVRGIANRYLTSEMALALGRAGAVALRGQAGGGVNGRLLVGRDTRRSGPLLQAAVAAGIASAGLDVEMLGVSPTPMVAFLTAKRTDCIGGVVISASHNPPEYNGVKFFDHGGFKLSLQLERAIEELVERQIPGEQILDPPVGAAIGLISDSTGAAREYLDHLARAGGDLEGLRVVLDCGNGAASTYAPEAFRLCGARVLSLADRPDGDNINVNSGSEYPTDLVRAMAAGGHDLGFAFDGDADRVVAVLPGGRLLDGDDLLYLFARALLNRHELPGGKVVATVMSNLGLDRALQGLGGRVVRCAVGDREVMATMRREDAVLGGETSGHIVFARHSTTGDGILTALLLARSARREDVPLEELVTQWEKYPQVRRDVLVEDKEAILASQTLTEEVGRARRRLGKDGRLVFRASGTEPVIRIMVEGPDEALIETLADGLASSVAARSGE